MPRAALLVAIMTAGTGLATAKSQQKIRVQHADLPLDILAGE
jgi:hypothetical protein